MTDSIPVSLVYLAEKFEQRSQIIRFIVGKPTDQFSDHMVAILFKRFAAVIR
jgi:hypothetical protein